MIKFKRIIHIPILHSYVGSYRVAYDGQYISLYGKVKDGYKEMLLIPIIEKIQGANPSIRYIDNNEIIIDVA